MRVGDIIEVDGVRAEVIGGEVKSDNFNYLDFQELESKKKRWIGVSPMGNPRVKLIQRGKGRQLDIAEWSTK